MPKCPNHCPFCNADKLCAPGAEPTDFEWTLTSNCEDSESTMARLFAEHNYR